MKSVNKDEFFFRNKQFRQNFVLSGSSWIYMKHCAFFLLLLLPVVGKGQSITGSVSGYMSDSISKEPLAFASMAILDQEDKIVNGSLTDERGAFKVSGLTPGAYRLQFSYVGYPTRVISSFELTNKNPDKNLGTLFISPTATLLEEIQVIGEAALIEARPDKIVYNAEQDLTTRGGDASDVLRKVPLLGVDIDGNVSLRGSENVQILINGKPSGIFNGNVGDALKMFPADQIKSVEVITSPSAKYDGEGTAGIVNIVTRKKNVEGIAGSIDITGGTRNNRLNGNINYGKGRFELNASSGGHYNWPNTGRSVFLREQFGDVNSQILQNGQNRGTRLGFRNFLGMSYRIDDSQTLRSEVSYRGHDSENTQSMFSNYFLSDVKEDSYLRTTDRHTARGGWDFELEYEKKFEKPEQTFSISGQLDLDKDKNYSNYLVDYILPEATPEVLQQANNLGAGTEWVLQADYQHPLTNAIKVETGVKATWQEEVNDFIFNENFGGEWNTDPGRTDIFTYDQNVYAAYLSTNIKIGKQYAIIAGARFEGTDIHGRFKTFAGDFANDYSNLLPNVTISKKLGEFNLVKVSYNQRIQRPRQRNVNPFIEYNDNRDISYGNPYLLPENVHQVELGTNWFIHKHMLNVSIFGRHSSQVIENLLIITPEGISESTFQNFGERDAIGMNVFTSINFTEKFTARGGIDVNFWKANGLVSGTPLKTTGYDYSGRLNITWNLSKTIRVEGFGFFRSPTITVQGRTPNWSMMSFGVRKEWPKQKLSLGINITEPFRENLNFIREFSSDSFYQYSNQQRPVRSFGISLGYRFGKLDFKDRSKRSQGMDGGFEGE